MKQLIKLSICAFLMIASCKNDAPAAEEGKSSGKKSGEYQCLLQNGYLLGVKVGDTIEAIEARFKKGLTNEKYQTGDGTFDIIVYKAPNRESIRIFPMEKGGKQVVHRVEYPGSLCKTDKGIGVSSTLADLQKAYPSLQVHGSEIEGQLTANAESWVFMLGGGNSFTYEVDIKTLSPDLRVTALVLQ
jgi:hypothetical protein